MLQRMILVSLTFIFFTILTQGVAVAAPLFPLQIGDRYSYRASDSQGLLQIDQVTVTGTTVVSGKSYFIMHDSDPYAVIRYVGSTQNSIYSLEQDIGEPPVSRELVVNASTPTASVSVPYGGPFTAYLFTTQGPECDEQDYVVPGLGIIKTVESCHTGSWSGYWYTYELVARQVVVSSDVPVFWRNTSTGESKVWYMNGTTMTSSANLLTVTDQNWKIVGTGDFNGDGKTDVVWRNVSTGANVVWYMDGTTMTSWASLLTVTDQNWKIVGTGDFNNDGKTDIVLRNTSTGQNVVWYMDGVNLTSWASLLAVTDQAWTIVGTGDFNYDGKTDILLRNTSTGQNVVWYMDGANLTSWASLPAIADQAWTIVGTGDFNKDGKIDILWRNTATGDNVVWYMNGASMTSWAALPSTTDLNWKIVGVK